MPRPHRPLRPRVLFALAAGLLAGACGGTLYDADGVPRVDPGATCQGTTHLCGGDCVEQSVAACGDACGACATAPAGGTPACLDQGGGAFACDYTCAAGLFKVNGGCAGPTAVAAGQQHTCAVVDGGALLCWGANGSGQLGPAAAGATSQVPRVVFTSGVLAVAAGGRHTCAVVGAGRAVQCWGANDLGQLGRGTTGAATAAPAAVSPALSAVDALAAGADHTCALSAGAVRCWGANAAGQSGTGTATTSVSAPGAPAIGGGAAAIAAGGGTACARTDAGGLLCWGRNDAGQTGRGDTGAALSPAQVIGLPAAGVVGAIAVGASHACTNTGSTTGLFCWGDNTSWQLGDGSQPGAASSVPVQARAVDNGSRFDGLLAAGGVFTCGERAGETGLNCGGLADDLPIGVPQAPPGPGNLVATNDVLPGGPILQVAAGGSHACALVDMGLAPAVVLQVRCWGRNAEGQLGRPTLDPLRDGTPGAVPP